MNKNGFTLAEILVVIALIGVLILITTPSLINIFSSSKNKTMKVQENELKDVGLLYLEDFCKNKIGSNECPATITLNENRTYSGYVTLKTLINADYIEEITLKSDTCNGCVIYTNNKVESYITCINEGYETETDVDFKSICNIN